MASRHTMETGDDDAAFTGHHRPGAMYMRAEARRTAETAGRGTAAPPARRRQNVRRRQFAVLGGIWLLIVGITIVVGLWLGRSGDAVTTARVDQPAPTATVAKASDVPTPIDTPRAAAETPKPVPAPRAAEIARRVEPPAAVPTLTKPVPAVKPAVARRTANTPPASTGPTRLVITSNPAGAFVTVDGVGWGATPVRIPYLPAGTKRVRVTLDGYTSQESSIQVAGGTTTLNVVLRRRAAISRSR